MSATPRHFIDLADFSAGEIAGLLDSAKAIKARRVRGETGPDRPLRGKKVAMIFEQPSLRTRMSFDVGIRELGGHSLMVSGEEIELGQRESIADTAKVLSRYVDAIVIRILSHRDLKELAAHASVPVINGLTKSAHPCQVMADVLTFEEHRGAIAGRTIAWVGDANNVLTSWVHAAARLGVTLNVAAPGELQPAPDLLRWSAENGGKMRVTGDPRAAVEGADCVITDCWVSMGDIGKEYRHNLLRPYQVDERLMAHAAKDALFMHCLPAKRGEEVAEAVIDGPQSAVFDEAENRLHAQKAILAWAMA
jgi:ornithine carbamoyltransferase